jgi:hypothetical protein
MTSHDKGTGAGFTVCPGCNQEFPYRRNKRVCSVRCRNKVNRTTQNGTESVTKRRHLIHRNDTAMVLAQRLYSLPPGERLGYVQELVQRAREGDTWLREVLSNHRLIKPNPIHDRHLFHRYSTEYCTISQRSSTTRCQNHRQGNAESVSPKEGTTQKKRITHSRENT